jgi:hypothetical protein
MGLRSLLLDNPVLVKHLRSRLRRQQLVPAVVAVVVMCALIVWGAVASDSVRNGGAFWWLLFIQGAILFLAGTSQVATTVGQAKETGILDFHRISPQPPVALALGFLFGAPVREYVLYACTLPFALLCVLLGTPSLSGLILAVIATLVAALLYHTLAMVAGLVSARAQNIGSGIVALILFLHVFGSFTPAALLTAVPAYREALPSEWLPAPDERFFGVPLPPTVVALIHQVPLLVFLFLAAVRKMRHERAFLYSKPLAVGFYGVIAVIVLGDVAGLPTSQWMPPRLSVLSAIYALAAAGVFLTLTVTPAAGEFANGVRRARKLGLRSAPLWSDLSANWAPVLAFTTLLLLAAALSAIQSPHAGGWIAPNIGAAFVGACAVLSFGCAKQAFDLMFRKSSGPYFLLLLFFLWIVPLLMAFIVGVSGVGEAVANAIGGISPIMGIALAGNAGESGSSPAGAMTAIGTSLMLVIIFLQLRLQAERRATELATKGREA